MSTAPERLEQFGGTTLLVVAGVFLGTLAIASPLAAICAIFGVYVVGRLSSDPLNAVGLLILVVPFFGTYWMVQNLTPLPGTKPYQLLAVLVAATALWNLHRAEGLPRYIVAFTILFLIFYTVCVLRALPHLEYMGIKGRPTPTVGKFLLSNYIKPLIFFLPFIVITVYCRSIQDLDRVIRFLAVATAGLALYVLYVYFRHARGLPIREASEIYNDYLAFHRNGVGSLLMVSFPFLIARFFLRRNVLNAAAMLITVAATCILFSRTAYATLAAAPVLYAIISRRYRIIPVMFGMLILIVLLSPSIVRERAMKGLDSNDVNEITAGRVDQVWVPIMGEYLASPTKLIFGRGRYAIVSSEASLRGQVLEVKSAHSMYMEQVLDGGLVGLFFMLAFLACVFGPIILAPIQPGDSRLREYRYAVIVAAACYLVGGLTGRTLFPQEESSFFWVMMAIAVAIPLISRSQETERSVKLQPAFAATDGN